MAEELLSCARLEYVIPLSALTQGERIRLADVLSGYAADILKGAATGGERVNFRIFMEVDS